MPSPGMDARSRAEAEGHVLVRSCVCLESCCCNGVPCCDPNQLVYLLASLAPLRFAARQMEWPVVPGATGYEVQMVSTAMAGGSDEWATIAASFGSTLLRKKGRLGWRLLAFFCPRIPCFPSPFLPFFPSPIPFWCHRSRLAPPLPSSLFPFPVASEQHQSLAPARTLADAIGSDFFACHAGWMLLLLCSAGLEGSKQYRFRIRPVFGGGTEERGDEWGWSPASALASPAVLNSFLRSQVPTELVGRGKAAVSRDVLAGKVVGEMDVSWD